MIILQIHWLFCLWLIVFWKRLFNWRIEGDFLVVDSWVFIADSCESGRDLLVEVLSGKETFVVLIFVG